MSQLNAKSGQLVSDIDHTQHPIADIFIITLVGAIFRSYALLMDNLKFGLRATCSFEFSVVFLLDRLPTTAIEPSLLCYISCSWWGKKRRDGFICFPKSIYI